ncbi:MAG: hypothetical protein AAF594_05560 [Bacteroidota bacterium]
MGARLGGGVDVAALVGYSGAAADTRFPYPAEVHLGADARWTVGREGSPWRLGASALVSVSGGNTFVFPPNGGTTEVRGGRRVREWHARAGVARYVRLIDGPVRIWGAGGAFAAVRQIESSTLIFQEGTPDEIVAGGDSTTETWGGIRIGLPIAVDLGRGRVLVVEPELRPGVPSIALGSATPVLPGRTDGQVTVRLNL